MLVRVSTVKRKMLMMTRDFMWRACDYDAFLGLLFDHLLIEEITGRDLKVLFQSRVLLAFRRKNLWSLEE